MRESKRVHSYLTETIDPENRYQTNPLKPEKEKKEKEKEISCLLDGSVNKE